MEGTELNYYQKFLVKGELEVWAHMGINFTKWYWDPWVEARQRSEAARLGFATFEGETLKLESVAQGVQKISRHLDLLSLAVSAKGCVNCVVTV